ncbi:MAG: HesB/IscA family protein [Thermodesulfovibrionales bacterium]
MLNVTESAAAKLREVLAAEGKEQWGVRLLVEDEGCCGSYGLDLAEQSAADDIVVEKDGVRIFIDGMISERVSGMTIDFIDEEERKGFVLTGGCFSCGAGGDSEGSSACGGT